MMSTCVLDPFEIDGRIVPLEFFDFQVYRLAQLAAGD